MAESDLERYRKKGPDVTTRAILEAVAEAGLESATLLDVGAGIGVLQQELLGTAVATAVHVEASSAYRELARDEIEARGLGDRVRFESGDLVDLAAGLSGADLVTLDRVVCCYPEIESLLRASASKASRLCVVSYPRDTWYTRLFNRFENTMRRWKGNDFRTYVHPIERMHHVLREAGLTESYRKTTFVWEIVGFQDGTAGRPGSMHLEEGEDE